MKKYLVLCLLGWLFVLSLPAQPSLASIPPHSPLEKRLQAQGLIDVQQAVPSIWVSLMYARPDNFVGRKLYTQLRRAYLLPEAAQALAQAQQALQREHPELSLIVYDATRPMSVQQHMWDVVKGTNKARYVSNPARGGGLHNYGLAVDITLCWAREQRDAQGRLLYHAGDTTGLSMGTPIDHLGPLAHVRDEAEHHRRGWLTATHLRHRRILRQAMAAGGYKVLPTEWWHFNFKSRAEAKRYYRPIP